MRAHIGFQPTSVAHPLDNAGHIRRAIQLIHLLWHAYVLVDQRLIIGYHILVICGRRMLDGVSGAAEEVFPEGTVDELEEGEDAVGADGGTRRLAVEEEGEETKTKWVALFVESMRKV